jgi:catechol 2,3-dioxygenase-like lactoylglutathione lyase family enzyme
MKINLSSVFVDDQDRALDFCTRVLGLREEDRDSARCGTPALGTDENVKRQSWFSRFRLMLSAVDLVEKSGVRG